MKRFAIIIGMFFGLIVQAQPNQVLFEQANQLYKNADYKNAIAHYQKITKSGEHSADLYFNMANCYYKLNEVAPAIYYYEKSLKLNPLHEDAKYNLILANRMTIDVIDEMPKTLIQKIETNFLHKISVATWAIIAVVLSILTALFFLIYYFFFSSILKRIFFSISITTFGLMIITILIAPMNQKQVLK